MANGLDIARYPADFLYTHLVCSFSKSMVFFLNECKPPTFLVKSLHAFGADHTVVDFNSKMKLLMGLSLVGNACMMASTKATSLSVESMRYMFNISTILINSGFGMVTARGLVSKSRVLCKGELTSVDVQEASVHHTSYLNGTDLELNDIGYDRVQDYNSETEWDVESASSVQIRVFLGLRMLAEMLCLFPAGLLVIFASLDLANETPTEGFFHDIRQSNGQIKPSLFVFSHLLMVTQQMVVDRMDDSIRATLDRTDSTSLWYVNGRFLEDYVAAGICTNLWTLGYSTAAILQDCRGPQGPSGDPSCVEEGPAEFVLNGIQFLMFWWLAAPLIEQAICRLDDGEFPVSTRLNTSVSEVVDRVSNTLTGWLSVSKKSSFDESA